MKFILLASLLTFSLSAAGQDVRDSIKYYEDLRRELYKRYQDSLRVLARSEEINENIRRLSAGSDNYGGGSFYFQSSSVDFTRLNEDITPAGFPAFSGNFTGFGFGLTFKKNRRIFDFNLFLFPLDKKSKKPNEKITLSTMTFFDFLWDMIL